MKKWLKVVLYVFGGLIGLCLIGAGIAYYYYYGRYPANDKKYPHHVGYLNPANPDFHSSFKRCRPKTVPLGYYHSAADQAFRIDKKTFVRNVRQVYDPQDFSASGFFNIRFLIDCQGNIGDYEINILNTEYEVTKMDALLVDQLTYILLDKKHWKGVQERDLYMYVILKLKDGELLEILP